MPRPPRKTNQISTWFNTVLRETRRGDIFKDEPAIATLDTVESLYPRLPRPPNEVGSEIEMNMAETGGGLNPLTPEIKSQLVIQRIEQMVLDKQAMEATVGTLQQEIEVEKNKAKTRILRADMENNARPESQDPIASPGNTTG